MLNNFLKTKHREKRAYACAESLMLTEEKNASRLLTKRGIRIVKTVEDKELDTQIIIAQTPTELIVLVPGTKTLADAYTDLSGTRLLYRWTLRKRKLSRHQMQEIRRDMKKAKADQKEKDIGLPHFGFYFSAWRLIYKLGLIADLIALGARGRKLIIAGHSLGGAIAPYLSYLLYKEGIKPEETFMFGAPAPGRKRFERNFDKALPCSYHYTHESDIVPFAALKVMGFKRVGKGLFINTKNRVEEVDLRLLDKRRFKGRKKNRKFDLIADHKLPGYVKSLKASFA